MQIELEYWSKFKQPFDRRTVLWIQEVGFQSLLLTINARLDLNSYLLLQAFRWVNVRSTSYTYSDVSGCQERSLPMIGKRWEEARLNLQVRLKRPLPACLFTATRPSQI